ncbi:hypothetical protein NKH28_32915 [Mesorhizobium sp. M1227]
MSSSASAALDAASSTARPPGTCQPTPSIWTKRTFLSEAADRYVRHQQCRRLLADGNALTRTALTITSAGALQQNFRRLMEQQELVEETGESAFDNRRSAGEALSLPPPCPRRNGGRPDKIAAGAGLTSFILNVEIYPYNQFDYNEKFIRTVRTHGLAREARMSGSK